MKKIILYTLLATAALPAMAETTGKVGLRFSFQSELDITIPGLGSGDTDGNAFGLYGEVGNSEIFGYVDRQSNNLDDADVDETRFGVGVRGGNDTGTVEARFEHYDVDLDLDGIGEGGDDGFGIHLGGALALNEKASAFASFGIFSLDESDGTEFQFGVRGNVSDEVELYGAYRVASLEDDVDVEYDLTDMRVGVNILF
ncbi:MAG: hypothetical protein P1U67_10190 [Alcanivoracaceae bacterium]|nr:hypothetical protein [Alcanivoracaceae bacterium]